MEKKVNLAIFFNYRSYSPKFRTLLEDVFYKKMHDEKLSSSDAMQQVMEFCNNVNEIEYEDFESEILCRYSYPDKKIMVNRQAVSSLQEQHKDLDEDALLKNIFQKQAENIIKCNGQTEIYDVTFEDILSKSGYVEPTRLADIADEDNVIKNEESVVEDIVTPKIAKKSMYESKIEVTKEDKRFVDSSETLQIGNIQNELKEKLNQKKNSFKNFFPEDEEQVIEDQPINNYENFDKNLKDVDNFEQSEDASYVAEEKHKDYDYDLLDCIKRKDDNPKNLDEKFTDFELNKDYSMNDFLVDEKPEDPKEKTNLFSSVKEKMSAFTDKIKDKLAKKEDEEDDEFLDKLDDFYANSDNLEDKETIDDEVESKAYNKVDDILYKKEDSKYSKYSYDIDESDIKVDDKFDNIISAIMREKQKEIEESEIMSYENNNKEDIQNSNISNSEDFGVEDEKNIDDDELSSVYDSFAEELETFESIRKRRRKR